VFPAVHTTRSAPFRCPVDDDVSTAFRPVFGHWRVTGERALCADLDAGWRLQMPVGTCRVSNGHDFVDAQSGFDQGEHPSSRS